MLKTAAFVCRLRISAPVPTTACKHTRINIYSGFSPFHTTFLSSEKSLPFFLSLTNFSLVLIRGIVVKTIVFITGTGKAHTTEASE